MFFRKCNSLYLRLCLNYAMYQARYHAHLPSQLVVIHQRIFFLSLFLSSILWKNTAFASIMIFSTWNANWSQIIILTVNILLVYILFSDFEQISKLIELFCADRLNLAQISSRYFRIFSDFTFHVYRYIYSRHSCVHLPTTQVPVSAAIKPIWRVKSSFHFLCPRRERILIDLQVYPSDQPDMCLSICLSP